MSQRRDLMERLVAADPAPDAEQLNAAEQNKADALLRRLLDSSAPPVVPPRRAGPLRWRRWMLVAAGAACSVLAAVAAIDLLDSDAPGAGVVEKAVAAVSEEDAVYHVLRRTLVPGEFLSGESRTVYSESWHTTNGRKHEKLFLGRAGRRGRLGFELAGQRRPGRTSGPALRYDPASNTIYRSGFGQAAGENDPPYIDPYADPGISLRALEQQGRLRLTGTTKVGDRRAYRLASEPSGSPPERERVEFLVDAKTYLPLAETRWWRVASGRTHRFATRYLVYERLQLDARSRAQLDLDPHPGATCATGAGKLRTDRPLGFPNPCPPSGRAGPTRTR